MWICTRESTCLEGHAAAFLPNHYVQAHRGAGQVDISGPLIIIAYIVTESKLDSAMFRRVPIRSGVPCRLFLCFPFSSALNSLSDVFISIGVSQVALPGIVKDST